MQGREFSQKKAGEELDIFLLLLRALLAPVRWLWREA